MKTLKVKITGGTKRTTLSINIKTRFSEKTVAQLKKIATARELGVVDIIREALREYLAANQ